MRGVHPEVVLVAGDVMEAAVIKDRTVLLKACSRPQPLVEHYKPILRRANYILILEFFTSNAVHSTTPPIQQDDRKTADTG